MFPTLTAVVASVVGLLATALFQQGSKIDKLSDRMDQRFERVEQRFERVDRRFDTVDLRMRDDKVELLGRMDVLAERIAHLEAS